jgi:N-terminal domain of anti-restriction factor ArdC
MRKPATAEQKAKAAEKRANMRALAARISKMNEIERAELTARLPGVVTIEGRLLSMHNQFMIALQNPSATVVGGFQQWKKAGRSVMKGQHGACIWFPLGDHKQDGTKDTNGAGDDDEKSSQRFGLATVFDVTQTEDKAVADARRAAEKAGDNPAAPRPEDAAAEHSLAAPAPVTAAPYVPAPGDGGPDWSDIAYEDSCRETCGL